MTHNQKVLRLLSDGKPHSHHELYALHVVAHSRISDLRGQGYQISQWREGDDYLYQLAPESAHAALLTRPAQETTPPEAGSSSASTHSPVQGELFTIRPGAYAA